MVPFISSSDELVQTFNIDDAFWKIGNPVGGNYGRVFINGLNCAADRDAGGNGCPLGGFWVWDAWLDIGESGVTLYAQTGLDLDNDGTPETFDDEQLLGTYVASAAGGANINVQMDVTDELGTPFVIAATLVDKKGFTGRDARFLKMGGSEMSFTFMGAPWVMERQ
jgi:hypothetical protein